MDIPRVVDAGVLIGAFMPQVPCMLDLCDKKKTGDGRSSHPQAECQRNGE